MNIGGFQSFTLIDYPNKMACIVFTQGCDFRCPYCQNPELVLGTAKSIPQEEIISFLWKRRGMLEGVVISGGEPTIQRDLEDFVKRIKDMGYLVKLDTNGHNPHVIQRLIDLLDYVAMDVKAPLYKYEEVVRAKADVIEEVGRYLASFKSVSHCYERSGWDYNLFAMLHGKEEEEVKDLVRGISQEIGLKDYALLFSTREFKKRRISYFSEDFYRWYERMA